MGGPALAQVDLDGIDVPLAACVSHGHEVKREPAEHAFPHQPSADLHGLVHDRRAVLHARREAASQIALAGRAAQHLVVRGQRLDLSERRHTQLRAGAAEVAPHDTFLDDAATLGQPGEERVE